MSDHSLNLKAAAKAQNKIEKIQDKAAAAIAKAEAKVKTATSKALATEFAAIEALFNSLRPEVKALVVKPEAEAE